jgi:uncharacterized protein YcbK (DUF882 family)
MGFGDLNVGQKLPLSKTLKKAVATAALAGTLGLGLFMSAVSPAVSGGETRTISMVHMHTGEKLTITYKQNGRYVPSAMKKLNYLLRDWRRNETVTIDPKTIDLIWELHADLGSRKPVHIVCGYRSPKTNAFLKRVGRKVAGKSQHMRGKAIDFYFPDVNTKKIRDMALAHGLGGVGYYRSSAGPSGFLHADSGNIRHWGPAISRSQLASIIKQNRSKIGNYTGKKGAFTGAEETMVADAAVPAKKKSGSIMGWFRGDKKTADEVPETAVAMADEPATTDGIYDGEGDEMAALSEDAAATTAAEVKAMARALVKARKPTPVVVASAEPALVEPEADPTIARKDRGALAALAGTAVTEEQATQRPSPVAASLLAHVPRPKLKPRIIMASAAPADEAVIIEPVSTEPVQTWTKKSNRPSQVADPIGTVEAAATLTETEDEGASTAASGKVNLESDIRSASVDDTVIIQPVVSTKSEPSWVTALFSSAEAGLRRDGVQPAPAAITSMPLPAILGPDGSGQIDIAAPVSADGKGDPLFVNREGKSSLPPLKLRLSSRQ